MQIPVLCKYHKQIYLVSLIIIAVSLPLSFFTLSIGIITLFINWVLEGNFREKYYAIKTNKAFWIFLLIYIVHLLGLFFTSNFDYAFHDIKIKLPLLILPIVLASSEELTGKQVRLILMFFVTAVLLGTLISLIVLVGLSTQDAQSTRDISLFISHIRFSLFINLSIFILSFFAFDKKYEFSKGLRLAFIPIILWLIVFLFLLKSLTGVLILAILSIALIIYYSGKIKHLVLKLFVRVSLLTVFLLFASFITHSIARFYSFEKIDEAKLEEHTNLGNKYLHRIGSMQIENGNYVWYYVCMDELRTSWNNTSDIDFDEYDEKGNLVRFTLIRYMSSKGFRKDAEDFKKLTQEDIRNVEKGISNYIFTDKYALYPWIYRMIWEINHYRIGKKSSGHSITQRIIYLKTGIEIWNENKLLGVGTGDVQDAFNKKYEANDYGLKDEFKRRAHNQYLTFLLTFGFIGFIIIIIGLVYPTFIMRKHLDVFFWIFFVIALMSMISEDTLETHTGVSFFAFFYSLFVFGRRRFSQSRTDQKGESSLTQ